MPARLDIPLKELKYLYLSKGLSSRKIAKIYGCAYSTIDRKIRLANLPIKTLAAAHIIYPRKDFSGNLLEKAYLIGFRIGDLRVRRFYKNSETVLVDCGSTKIEQINLIKNLFLFYGRVWISKPNLKGSVQIQCHLNNSFDFLLSKMPEKWLFREKDCFFAFLAGFTDAEGSIFISQNQAHYSIGNYDVALLRTLQNVLEKYNIKKNKLAFSPRAGLIASHGYRYNHDYWTLRVDRKADILSLLALLKPYLKHAKRIRQMKLAIKNIERRNKLYGQK